MACAAGSGRKLAAALDEIRNNIRAESKAMLEMSYMLCNKVLSPVQVR